MLYATVGCRTPGEELDANFGDREYTVDYGEMHRCAIQRTMAAIMVTNIVDITNTNNTEGAESTGNTGKDDKSDSKDRADNKNNKNSEDGSRFGQGGDGKNNRGRRCGFIKMDAYLDIDHGDKHELYHVLQYLIHHGFTDTASALMKEAFNNNNKNTTTTREIGGGGAEGSSGGEASASASTSGILSQQNEVLDLPVLSRAAKRFQAMQCLIQGDMKSAEDISEELCPGIFERYDSTLMSIN